MNRRLIASATFIVVLLISFAAFQTPTQALPSAADQPCGPTSSVKGIIVASLRLRDKPSNTGNQIGLLAPNDVVVVTGRNTSGTWILVQTPGGLSGWVGSPYVVLVKANLNSLPILDASGNVAEGATPDASAGIKGLVVVKLTIRAKPSIGDAALGTLNPDDIVTVTGRNASGTWLQISTPAGVSGWVASPYIVLLRAKLTDVPVADSSSNAAATEAPDTSTAAATMAATMASTMSGTAAATNCPPATQANAGVTLKGTVISASLKIRTKPSITAPEAGDPLKANDSVTVVARTSSGVWLKITTAGGVTGWVASQYVVLVDGHLEDLPIIDSADLQ
jgi:uncharacterized protein YgiM (DUF1202 family)